MAKYVVRPELIEALITAESNWNPNAVSAKGARGLAQIMPATAKDPGFGITPLQDDSVEEHRRFANDYLGAMLDRYNGDERLAVAAYNTGFKNVDKYGDVPPFRETQSHVSKIDRMLNRLNPISSAQADDQPDELDQLWDEINAQPLQAQPDELDQLWDEINAHPTQRQWSDVPIEALQNTPASAGRLVSGIAQSVVHPIDTTQNLLDAITGEVYGALPDAISKPLKNLLLSTEKQAKTSQAAEGLNALIKERYGSMEAFKDTLATDPVGALADLSLVFGGSSALLKAGNLPSAARAASRISALTNPVTHMAKAGSLAGKGAKLLSKELFGRATGVGSEVIGKAAEAGKTGDRILLSNLKGNVPIEAVLDQAKTGLSNMQAAASREYQHMMQIGQARNSPVVFAPVKHALHDVKSDLSYTPGNITHQVVQGPQKQILHRIEETVKRIQNDPAAHNVMGMDTLKRQLDAIDINPRTQKLANMARTRVRQAVYDSIVSAEPTYAPAMAAYEESMKLMNTIDNAFSLKGKSQQTAISKLQSLARNNAQTQYGHRLNLAEKLKQHGGQDIMSAVSGQAMNSWMPRGLTGNLESIATAAATLHNPLLAGLFALQSPKLVGLTSYYLGKGSNYVPNIHPALLNALSAADRYDPQ